MELRVRPQMPRLEDLISKEILDRASPECSQRFIQEMTALLNNYNKATDDCENSLQASLKELDKGAAAKLKELSTRVATVCAISTECTESGPTVDNLSCFETKVSLLFVFIKLRYMIFIKDDL